MKPTQFELDAAALETALKLPKEVQKDINMPYLIKKVFGKKRFLIPQ